MEIQPLKRWSNASSTVIIRQNHHGSFSDPILSSGCSCVKPMLALLASNVAPDVVFTSKKEWCFGWWQWCFALSSHNLAVCFHCFSVFHFSPFSTSANVVDALRCFCGKESNYSWMNDLGMVEVYWEPCDVREHSVGGLPTKARLHVDFKIAWTACWVRTSFC